MKIKYIALCLLLVLIGCQRDEEMEIAQINISNECIEPSYSTAFIRCNITSNVTIERARVCVSASHDFSNANYFPLDVSSGNYSANINGLVGETTYYVRYEISNRWSSIMTDAVSEFQTIKTIPIVSTSEPMNITNSSAIVGGNVIDHGGYAVTDCGVVYSTKQYPTIADKKITSGSGTGTFTCNLTGLQPNTTYYLRAYATNDKGTAYGEEVSFITLCPFSISSTRQVIFSSGNLQYHPANDAWRFAESQLDYIDDANSNISDTYNGWLDLFGWSTSATSFGVSTSTDYADYYGSFVDWGTNQIGNDAPNTWRTLTKDEWDYLLNNRTNAGFLKGVAQVNGVNGLILLPDDWTCPAGITFKSGFHSSDGVDYYAAYQTFTADQWSQLEGAGAVFLPAAGIRYGSNVNIVQYGGGYWSATEDDLNGANCLYFRSDEAGMGSNYRNLGHIVRLVKDL